MPGLAAPAARGIPGRPSQAGPAPPVPGPWGPWGPWAGPAPPGGRRGPARRGRQWALRGGHGLGRDKSGRESRDAAGRGGTSAGESLEPGERGLRRGGEGRAQPPPSPALGRFLPGRSRHSSCFLGRLPAARPAGRPRRLGVFTVGRGGAGGGGLGSGRSRAASGLASPRSGRPA